MRRAAVVLLFAACGRIAFDLRGDADGDATGDATSDATAVTGCWQAWLDGTVALSAPEPLTVLNAQTYHADPSLTSDALFLYYSRAGTLPDIYVAARVDRTLPFGAGIRETDLSSADTDGKVTLSSDALTAVWASDRAGSMGYDLWQSRRATRTAAFAVPPTLVPGAINDAMSQYDPHLSSDSLRLYYAPEVAGFQSIVLSTRPTLTDSFGAPSVITDLGPGVKADPALSPDERVLVFSRKPTNPDSFRLFYATRASTALPFSNAREIPGVNIFVHQQDATLSFDGCELFFSGLTGGTQQDLYTARVQ